MTDFEEKERKTKLEITIPTYGSDVHVEVLADRVQSVLNQKFPNAELKRYLDEEQGPRPEVKADPDLKSPLVETRANREEREG